MALEDNAVVLLPLQYARLLEMPREGAFTYRDQLVATGAAQPRSVTRYNLKGEQETSVDEKFLPQKTIERILRDVEIGKISALVETLRGLSAALQSIRATTTEHVGFEQAIEFPKLGKLASEMAEFARGVLVMRDPTLAPAPEAAPGAEGEGEPAPSVAAPSAFATRADVDAALGSALGYFATSEPTSPALLLIRQARVMLGKNLYEVMQLLAPPHADNARVSVGPDGAFTVPVKTSGGRSQRRDRERGVSARFVARGGAGAHRRRRAAHAARRAFQSRSVSARAGEEPRIARLRQPAPRRVVRGRHRVSQEGRVRVIGRAR